MSAITKTQAETRADGLESLLPSGTPWHLLPPHIPRALRALCAERDAREVEIKTRFESRTKAAETERAEQLAAIETRNESERAAADGSADQESRAIRARSDAEIQSAREEHSKARAKLLADAERRLNAATKRRDQTRWESAALFEAAVLAERQRHEETLGAIAAEADLFAELQGHAEAVMARYRRLMPRTLVEPARPGPEAELASPLDDLRSAIQGYDHSLAALMQLRSAQPLLGANPIWIVVVPLLVLVVPAVIYLGSAVGIIAAFVGSLAIAAPIAALCWKSARKQLARLVPELNQQAARAASLIPKARDWAIQQHQHHAEQLDNRRVQQTERAESEYAAASSEAESRRTSDVRKLDEDFHRRVAELEGNQRSSIAAIEADRVSKHRKREQWYLDETQRIHADYTRRMNEAGARKERDWNALVQRWSSGLDALQDAAATIKRETEARSFDWDCGSTAWRSFGEVPPALRFGRVDVELARVPHGPPRDPQLRAATPASIALPALLAFPDRASVLVRARGEGKSAAIDVLQAAMLRYVTSLPPGKVRFTIIDPVGLGRHFAGFMHLADYSELLVNSRIWTEPQHIEQRLADLSLHMENVIQQFLRNEFANLEEYNRQAAEVAEPYRVLVVANFPANFNDSSAQRLLSIAQGGARCGVHTLILVDEDQPVPSTINVDDLQAHAVTLAWTDGQLAWRDPDFASFPLTLDAPPPDAVLTPLLHQVGQAARAASRVEVPFEVIAPARERWWAASTNEGVDIALGRAGATKLQGLKLGRGTSQHVLIAGRTGSGKSTLLHALVTNAALLYSPDEIEFYLIDFKKGVEFQTYAQHELPHARVIAIESEREFGLSVLQRLDEELKRRGEAFRAAGVQDLAGYRQAPGTPPLPRTLLIVDEFQEFFVDDDKLAQDAALLLDRLVRQGRAFGIHVILGSQTLGGAYSLARTTLGQMAVRIALQCSEADAHLILSEDNAAARLLSRPGEAIYNDANGLVEGNHVFQVVWLPESRREDYLKLIRERSLQPDAPAPRPQIVFEGHIPAALPRNSEITSLVGADGWPEAPKALAAWLGDAVAIKDPTTATFRRQGGNNLLLIGQDAPAARGIFASALFSLGVQAAPDKVQFALLDGTPDDDPDASVLRDVAAFLPHAPLTGGTRDTASLIGPIYEQLQARQANPTGAASIFLFLFDGSRFRDLRKSDDDFGFGRRDDAQLTPAQQLGEILREGPALGIHVVAWFDTLNNLQRVLDRSAMREFEARVLFQMSANDSSTLIDSPLANRLGQHRALLSSEERGTLEKFRPYAIPPRKWVETLGERLSQRL